MAKGGSSTKSDLPRKRGSKHLTASAINRIAFAVHDGKAIPREAKQLMVDFCRYDEQNQEVPPSEFRRLIHHFAECFAKYLKRGRSLEGALGLSRKMGHPEADEVVRVDIATRVLRLRLDGTTHQDALDAVSSKCGYGQTVIGKAFSDHTLDAIAVISNERRIAQEQVEARRPEDKFTPWSADEKGILQKILERRNRKESGKPTRNGKKAQVKNPRSPG
jgi:hypothetical protein